MAEQATVIDGTRRSRTRLVSRALAVGLAVACWLVVYTVLHLVLQWIFYTNEALDDVSMTAINTMVAVWAGLAIIVATRVAAGVLRRRGVRPVLWLLVLPAMIAADAFTYEGRPESLWPFLLLFGGGIAGSVAALRFGKLPPARS